MEVSTGKDSYVKANPAQYPSRKDALAKAAADKAKAASAPAKVMAGKSK